MHTKVYIGHFKNTHRKVKISLLHTDYVDMGHMVHKVSPPQVESHLGGEKRRKHQLLHGHS